MSIQVRFNAKVNKPPPGREEAFLRILRHFIGIVHRSGSLPEREVPGGSFGRTVSPLAGTPSRR